MIIQVLDRISPTLEDPDTFTAFHVNAPGLDLTRVVAALGGDAVPGDDDHVWIAIERLHRLGATHGGSDWRKGCDGMIEYARSQGWVDADDRVRAHIET